jgi:glyoxylase-like metal-dependent hydrolase (beta-lactamase superfamily II)
MINERVVVGAMKTNCYIIGSEKTREAVVVDPGASAEAVLGKIDELGVSVRYIVNTHAHPDHTGANRTVKQTTGAELLIHPLDAPRLTVKDDR